MNGIMGYAEQMASASSAQDFEEESPTVLSKTILECCKHIIAILDNVLDISKMEAGKLMLRKLPVSCAVMCREIKQSLASQCADCVAFDCTAQPGLALMADGIRWKQVLINLVSNSLKLTRAPGGRVHLKIHKDDVSGAIVCSVSDTGCIIPPELRDRLFSKYEQAKQQTHGTGLGLVISQVRQRSAPVLNAFAQCTDDCPPRAALGGAHGFHDSSGVAVAG